jgi:hypothetical protein
VIDLSDPLAVKHASQANRKVKFQKRSRPSPKTSGNPP